MLVSNMQLMLQFMAVLTFILFLNSIFSAIPTNRNVKISFIYRSLTKLFNRDNLPTYVILNVQYIRATNVLSSLSSPLFNVLQFVLVSN